MVRFLKLSFIFEDIFQIVRLTNNFRLLVFKYINIFFEIRFNQLFLKIYLFNYTVGTKVLYAQLWCHSMHYNNYYPLQYKVGLMRKL